MLPRNGPQTPLPLGGRYHTLGAVRFFQPQLRPAAKGMQARLKSGSVHYEAIFA